MKYIIISLKIIAIIILAPTGLFWFAIGYFIGESIIFLLPLLLCMFCWFFVWKLFESLFKGLEDEESENTM